MKNTNPYRSLQIIEPKDHPFTEEERLKAINEPMLAWFEASKRVLPWRENITPYRVWISEIMLQQTRVEAVKPYFERFFKALPDIKALSEVPDEVLMKLWEGLGYYNRGRNLKKAAQYVMEHYEGELPDSYEELLTLPGIGPYTAGAIASIAFQIPVPAVDGNVLRVISRLLASEEDILKQSVKRKMETMLKSSMPAAQAGSFNQALMEIGAIVCIPNGQPKCGECPLGSLCLARAVDKLSVIPVKTKKKPRKVEARTILVIENGTNIVLNKRPDSGLLAGLYEFPNLEGSYKREEIADMLLAKGIEVVHIRPLESSKHIFSHVEWRMEGYHIRAGGEFPVSMTAVEKSVLKKKYPIPSAYRSYMKYLDSLVDLKGKNM